MLSSHSVHSSRYDEKKLVPVEVCHRYYQIMMKQINLGWGGLCWDFSFK